MEVLKLFNNTKIPELVSVSLKILSYTTLEFYFILLVSELLF